MTLMRLTRQNATRSITRRLLSFQNSELIKTISVKDQTVDNGEINCCLSAAIAVCFEVLERKDPSVLLSELYHYHYASNGNAFQALTLREAVRTAEDFGICRHELHSYPMGESSVKQRPSTEARNDGEDRQLLSYQELSHATDISSWKRVLADGFPLILMFRINREDYLNLPNTQSIYRLTTSPSHNLGHAVVVKGFDSAAKCFVIQDCRGTAWCQDGCWLLPEATAKLTSFTHTVFFIEKISTGEQL